MVERIVTVSKTKIVLNDDRELVREVRAQLKDTDGFCPCRIERTPDTKCPCKEFRDMTNGECHCGLYIKVADDE